MCIPVLAIQNQTIYLLFWIKNIPKIVHMGHRGNIFRLCMYKLGLPPNTSPLPLIRWGVMSVRWECLKTGIGAFFTLYLNNRALNLMHTTTGTSETNRWAVSPGVYSNSALLWFSFSQQSWAATLHEMSLFKRLSQLYLNESYCTVKYCVTNHVWFPFS